MGKNRKRHRRRRRATPGGHAGGGAAGLLAHVAEALNDCEAAGIRIRWRHGAGWAAEGVILPPVKNTRWAARLFTPAATPAQPSDLET